jgi:hypothetical protein
MASTVPAIHLYTVAVREIDSTDLARPFAPLATRALAGHDLVNARPRLSNSSYQFKSICRWAKLVFSPFKRAQLHSVCRTDAPRRPFFARTTPAAAQKAAAAHAQLQADLGTLRGEQLGRRPKPTRMYFLRA